MTSAASAVSVIVPMYNAAATIARCLQPLLRMQANGEVQEIIIVDDCSTDHGPALVRALPVKLLRAAGRGGPAAARNIAAQTARGDWLWFVDSDVVVHADAAAVLTDAIRNTDVAAVFGAYDDHPAATNFLSQYENLVHRYYHRRGHREAATFWAGCGAVRADAFKQIDGFDGLAYPYPSIEDIELGARLRRGGQRILLQPRLQCTHLKHWTLGKLLHTAILRRALPWSRLMLAEGALTNDLNVSTGERLRAGLAGLWLLAVAAALSGYLPWVGVLAASAALVIANGELLQFFRQRRGAGFALRAFLFHQVYYLYSGATFVFAWTEHHWSRAKWSH